MIFCFFLFFFLFFSGLGGTDEGTASWSQSPYKQRSYEERSHGGRGSSKNETDEGTHKIFHIKIVFGSVLKDQFLFCLQALYLYFFKLFCLGGKFWLVNFIQDWYQCVVDFNG